MKYEGVATLGVNLNRQKYGPLDVSSVLLTLNDLKGYCAGDVSQMSDSWTGGTPYPYPGQIIVVLEDNTAYQLFEEEDVVKYRPMLDLSNFYSKKEIDEMLSSVEVDMSDYYNKEEIDALINAIEGVEGTSSMVALSAAEILAITGNLDAPPIDSTSGQVLVEMTADDVKKIIEEK